jgi:ketosteroid isomerase-like protein
MSTATSRSHVEEWIAAYEDAWRTPDTSGLGRLFTEDATYQLWPYDPVLEGLAAIKKMWDTEREGPGEIFTMSSSIVALESDTAVARVEVTYGNPVTQEYRDLWIMRFAADGRCAGFEEWPFWPDRGRTPPDTP